MKKKALVLIALAIVCGIGIFVINACSKSDLQSNEKVHFSVNDLVELNEYKPDKESIPDLYRTFRNEIKAVKEAEFKTTIDPVDREVTEAVWLLDATTNTELGFRNDSIEEIFEDTLKITFTNKSFNSEGMPIIDGNDIVVAYIQFENKVLQELASNYLLWDTRVEISAITSAETSVDLISNSGSKGSGMIRPLAPGIDPVPFPEGTSFSMGNGAVLYNVQCKAPGVFLPDPNYIWYFHYWHSEGYYKSPGVVDDRIAHSTMGCWDGMISGSWVNYYLFGEKDVIDEMNPNGWYELYCGHFTIGCLEFSSPPIGYIHSEHLITLFIYEVVEVGDPD